MSRMRDGFLLVAVGTPAIKVGDTDGNKNAAIQLMRGAAEAGAKVLTLPELCLTGYTSGDLFLQKTLREGALEALRGVVEFSRDLDLLTVVGLPLEADGHLYNVAAVVKDGRILGIVPKRNPPNYGEFYELRHFTPGPRQLRPLRLLGSDVPFGGDMLFVCEDMPDFKVGVEVCEDLWVPDAPSTGHALAGATVLLNPSASDETIGKAAYRELLLKSQSARLIAAYLYADAGAGESSTDMVYSGHNLIAENGAILAQSKMYETGLTMADVDVEYLASERLRMNTFGARENTHVKVPFVTAVRKTRIRRFVDPAPFVPSDRAERDQRCEQILAIQVNGLMQRLRHIGCKSAAVGVSGGLDSTLALIVAARAFKKLGLPLDGLAAVTMPCFGTTERTHDNARKLAKGFGAKLIEVDITRSVRQHLEDIGHDESVQDVTYENAQARERTQVLMDLANKLGGIVIGTGDLSELALGWATYNGDHMSMYGVNMSVPKTLVRHLVSYAADHAESEELAGALRDVLDTPVSPELLPPVDGVISQKTEDIVGPYELHDFFLYHLVRRMAKPSKILRLAILAFRGAYDEETIEKWLRVFLKRFFQNQFKRSCIPDGPKVGSVTLSPRGDWRMPSDAESDLWMGSLR
jgi:NAD+ synthase (glutamine-hydrolysing)